MASSPSEPTDSNVFLMWPGLDPSTEMQDFAEQNRQKRTRVPEGEGRPVAFDSPPGSPPPPSPPPPPVKEKRKCSAFPVQGEPPGKKIVFSDSSPEPPARKQQAAGAAATEQTSPEQASPETEASVCASVCERCNKPWDPQFEGCTCYGRDGSLVWECEFALSQC